VNKHYKKKFSFLESLFQIWERGDASGFLGLYISDLVNSADDPHPQINNKSQPAIG
jgi:hypothetical protein